MNGVPYQLLLHGTTRKYMLLDLLSRKWAYCGTENESVSFTEKGNGHVFLRCEDRISRLVVDVAFANFMTSSKSAGLWNDMLTESERTPGRLIVDLSLSNF